MSIFGLHPVYSYLLLTIIFVILFCLLPTFIIHPFLRENLKQNEYQEESNFLLLNDKQEKAFEYIAFNNDINKPVISLKLKENVNKADIDVVYILNNKKEVKHYSLTVNKDNKRTFDISLVSRASLYLVNLNSYNNVRMESTTLYILKEPSVFLLTILQCVFITLAAISVLLCIQEIAIYNELMADYIFSMELFGMTIGDSGVLIIVLIISMIFIFPTLLEMNKNLYKKELYGGWLND